MKMIFFILLFFNFKIFCQDNYFLQVHFLYGSSPKNKESQPKYFGGKLGGHVGISIDSNEILNFCPNGKFHKLQKKNEKHSKYIISSYKQFYEILGDPLEDAKKLIVKIPISKTQKIIYDSIKNKYLLETPYDYAFIGYRCGAAAYDILAQMGILKKLGFTKTYLKIFYPRKLRKKILKKAKENNWHFTKQNGTYERKWEKDF